MRRRLLAVAALAAAVVSGCSEEAADPPRLTWLDLEGARALVSVRSTDGGLVACSVDAAGELHPLAANGWALEIEYGVTQLVHRVVPLWYSPVPPDHFLMAVGGGGDPRDPVDAAYLKVAVLVDRRTGTATNLFPHSLDCCDLDHVSNIVLRGDGAGRLFAAVEDWPDSQVLSEIRELYADGESYTLGWPRSAEGDEVLAFWACGDGDLAYRARRTEGGVTTEVLVLAPRAGPLVVWPDAGELGDPFVAADGRLLVTRSAAGGAGATELLRVDFGVTTTATPVASWAGAPGHLRGEPIALGDRRLFLREGELVELGPDHAPVIHAFPFVRSPFGEVLPYAEAFWFVAEDALGAPTRLVRWADGAGQDLLPAGEYEVYSVVPWSDDGAVVGLVRRADGARLVARVDDAGTLTPLDAGAEPMLFPGLPLP